MSNDESDEPVKINKWDGNAVKNALDDAVKKVLSERLQYSLKMGLVDGRLGLSTVAVGFALFALAWDYLHPFPKSRPVLIVCVAAYFVLMGVLQLYTWYVEGAVFCVAIDDDPTGARPARKWLLSSKMKKYDDKYTLEVSVSDGGAATEGRLEKSIEQWVDEDGAVVAHVVQADVLALHQSLSSTKKKN